MRALLGISLALLASFLAGTAFAQVKPTILISEIPEAAKLLNINELEEEEDAPIELEWTATVDGFLTYEYELTYDFARTEQARTATIVVLDDVPGAGKAEGDVVNGRRERFRIRPRQIVLPNALPGGSQPLDDARRSIVLRVCFMGCNSFDVNSSATAEWKFRYDTKPPPPPTLIDLKAGENNLKVAWSPPVPETDVDKYEVVYCPDATDSNPVDGMLDGLPCETPIESVDVDETTTDMQIEDGLRNNVPAAVAARSIDEFGNKGVLSSVVLVLAPSEVTDFFEQYKEDGGKEDGGFCFIATAAYGSYAHPTVRVLRLFRDVVLANLPGGSSLIELYYEYSPPLAARIARSPLLAAYARAELVPITMLAIFWMCAPLIALFGLFFIAVRRMRFASSTIAVVLAIGGLLAAADARADDSPRPKAESRFGFGFEFRGGPYLPQLGEESGTASNPGSFEKVFGAKSRPLFALGLDVQIYRGIGTAGIGGSFGFMQWVAKAFYGNNGPRSPDTTVFNLLPLTLTAFYRFDWLADRSPVPLVPYARGGLAYYVWWVTNGKGDVSRWDSTTDLPDDDVAGRGGKLGLTGTLGLALLLNTFEPDAARGLFDSTGIRGTYVFGEVAAAQVDGFGADGFDLSDTTWNLGVYFEW